ncbi:MAG: hypothetical protein SVK08_00680 [Halobacteriota archaeon]|nr:hypothetical protein [Halobacteriota archaeon]
MIQRHIYEVIVVAHSAGDIIATERRVATSSEAAMAKINIFDICQKENLTVDEVEYAILKLASLRPIQEVATTEIGKF